MKHEIVKQWKYIHSMDCLLYNIECSCGKVFSEWIPKDVEEKFKKHLEEVKEK